VEKISYQLFEDWFINNLSHIITASKTDRLLDHVTLTAPLHMKRANIAKEKATFFYDKSSPSPSKSSFTTQLLSPYISSKSSQKHTTGKGSMKSMGSLTPKDVLTSHSHSELSKGRIDIYSLEESKSEGKKNRKKLVSFCDDPALAI
jgi:hypothetical protein